MTTFAPIAHYSLCLLTIAFTAIVQTGLAQPARFWLTSDVGFHEYRQRFILCQSNNTFGTFYYTNHDVSVVNDLDVRDLSVANVHDMLLGVRLVDGYNADYQQILRVELLHFSLSQAKSITGTQIALTPLLTSLKNAFQRSTSGLGIRRVIVKPTSNGIEIFFSGTYEGTLTRPLVGPVMGTRGDFVSYAYPFYGTVELRTNGTVIASPRIYQYWRSPRKHQYDCASVSLVEMSGRSADQSMLTYNLEPSDSLHDRIDLIRFRNGRLVGEYNVLTDPEKTKQGKVIADQFTCQITSNEWLYLNMPIIALEECESPHHYYNSLITNSFGPSDMMFHNVNSVFPVSFSPIDYQFRDGQCFVVGIDSNGPVLCSASVVNHQVRMTATRVSATSRIWEDFIIVPGRETNCVLVLERTTGTIWRTALRHSYP